MKPSLLDRTMPRVDRSGPGECWLWAGTRRSNGYGTLVVDGRRVAAHRAIYEVLVGSIPDGMQLDHLCHNDDLDCLGGNSCPHRRCVNPAHLEPVTNRENTLRGRAATVNAKRERSKGQCKNGHPLSGDNVNITRAGYRVCRACARDKARRSFGDRTTQRKRGPLRDAVRHEGRLSYLACGHVVRRHSGNQPKRSRCAECQAGLVSEEPPGVAA